MLFCLCLCFYFYFLGEDPENYWWVKIRDEIKSWGKFAIRSLFKIARTPSLPPLSFHDVSAILNSHLHWTPSLPPILNELRIVNFPELLMSSLSVTETIP